MKVTITGHHTDTGNALRTYVEEHLSKVSKFFDAEIEPKVIFEKEHNSFKAEILIKDQKGNHAEFIASDEHEDIHGAFELALQKITHQIRKYHEKVKKGFKKKMKAHEKEIDMALSSNPDA
ncbi:MAG: ribosome-associated translation inhibitor RaiA [Rickettsiales bacterium]